MRKDDVSLAYYGCHTDITIPYEELDFHYPDWAFIITGCIFFGVVVGVTLLYFAFIKH